MANNPVPVRGTKLVAVSGQESNFILFGFTDKAVNNFRRYNASDFDRVVSNGTVEADTNGGTWLKAIGYRGDEKAFVGFLFYDDAGVIWQDQPTELLPVPAVPVQLSISSAPDRSITIKWDAISNGTVYIERASIVQGPFDSIGLVKTGENSFMDTNLRSGLIYYYRLASSNDFGESNYTPVLSIVARNEGATTADPIGSTVTSPAPSDGVIIPPTVDNTTDANVSADNVVAYQPKDEPLVAWIKKNTALALVIGGGIIVALMVIIVASRRT